MPATTSRRTTYGKKYTFALKGKGTGPALPASARVLDAVLATIIQSSV